MSLGYYIDSIDIPLEFTVREVEIKGREDAEELDRDYGVDSLLQLSIGRTVIWTEDPYNRLYWDRYGDGGPGLSEAILEDVIGPIFAKLLKRVEDE